MTTTEETEEIVEDFTIIPDFLKDAAAKRKKNLYRLPEWMSSLAKRLIVLRYKQKVLFHSTN